MKRERERERVREKKREKYLKGALEQGGLKVEAEAVTVTDERSLMRGEWVTMCSGPISDEGRRFALDCDWTDLW